MMVTVHVDDMFVAGTKVECETSLKFLSESFPVNNLGE